MLSRSDRPRLETFRKAIVQARSAKVMLPSLYDKVPRHIGLALSQLIRSDRIDASAFKPQKDQRQALNRWNRFVLGEDYIREVARLDAKTKEEKARRKNEFDNCATVHECEYLNLSRPYDTRLKKTIEPTHKFEVSLESDSFTEEKYALFANYQRLVQQEPLSRITRTGFKRFLCSSPLDENRCESISGQNLGSFHQCYRLDGRLIAMAVLDLLPHCVSGVYFVYHNDFKQWSFGKISALRETALAVEGGYNYYYMGYYIHSCIKMRYKADYHPQYILDPETYQWDLLDPDLKRRLDVRKYVSLSRQRRLGPEVPPKESLEAQKPTIEPSFSDRNSLFEQNMPGVLTAEEVESQIDLGEMLIKLNNNILQLQDLVGWDKANTLDPKSIKRLFGEFAATLGPKIVEQVVIDWNQEG